jgi:hypothetical protein
LAEFKVDEFDVIGSFALLSEILNGVYINNVQFLV